MDAVVRGSFDSKKLFSLLKLANGQTITLIHSIGPKPLVTGNHVSERGLTVMMLATRHEVADVASLYAFVAIMPHQLKRRIHIELVIA